MGLCSGRRANAVRVTQRAATAEDPRWGRAQAGEGLQKLTTAGESAETDTGHTHRNIQTEKAGCGWEGEGGRTNQDRLGGKDSEVEKPTEDRHCQGG